jgi:replicative DNA helicase
MNIELTKEQLIIGALILDHDNKAIEIITSKIFPSDFESKKDAVIYEAILQLKNQKKSF